VLVPLNKLNAISNNKHNPRTTEVDRCYAYRSGIELHEMIMDSDGGEWERNRLKGKGKLVPSLAIKA